MFLNICRNISFSSSSEYGSFFCSFSHNFLNNLLMFFGGFLYCRFGFFFFGFLLEIPGFVFLNLYVVWLGFSFAFSRSWLMVSLYICNCRRDLLKFLTFSFVLINSSLRCLKLTKFSMAPPTFIFHLIPIFHP